MAISVEEARAMTEEQLQETITEMAFEIIAQCGHRPRDVHRGHPGGQGRQL